MNSTNNASVLYHHFQTSRKTENTIYLNRGVYHNAYQFQIRGENTPPVQNKQRKNKALLLVYRTYVVTWFSIYFIVSMAGKLLKIAVR